MSYASDSISSLFELGIDVVYLPLSSLEIIL
jgi:hypothetical protein